MCRNNFKNFCKLTKRPLWRWCYELRVLYEKKEMALPLIYFSEITMYKSSLTPLSCFLSHQLPSSANSTFLLACKSIPIIPHTSFCFRLLLFLAWTISIASSLCSILSFTSIPWLHYCQGNLFQREIITPLLASLHWPPPTCYYKVYPISPSHLLYHAPAVRAHSVEVLCFPRCCSLPVPQCCKSVWHHCIV